MTTQKIYTSAELMTNYMQAETLAPDKKFEALQTEMGYSLLFSIGTDQRFYLTEEASGEGTGWQRRDLTAGLTGFFPGKTLVAKTFAVDQQGESDRFTIALVVTVDDTDQLFIASQYTKDADNRINGLVWQAAPFTEGDTLDSLPEIANVYVWQTPTAPLVVANVVPAGQSTFERYYVDCQSPDAPPSWKRYALPVNMDAANVRFCGGRRMGDSVDGTYTLGTVGSAPALFYQQLYQPFAPSMAGATALLVTGDGYPEAFASTPAATATQAGTTDLYVATETGGLYLFTADNQNTNAQGIKLMTHELLQGIGQMHAYTIGDHVVVWGLNRAQQVFYTECATAQVTDPAAWSYPLPVASQVVQLAPYKNRVNGGNTFFAQTGTNTLKKAMQDPVSTSWTMQDILLPVTPDAKAEPCDCYITRITVCDTDNAPLPDCEVELSSAYRVPVYINNHYYVLDTTPIPVRTGPQGALKVVQRVDNLQGARITVHLADDVPLTVNPVDNAAKKVATLNTADSLSQAQVTNDRGEVQQPLVAAGTDAAALDSAAASIQAISDAYVQYNGTPPATQKQATFIRPDFRFSPTARVHAFAVNRATMQLSVIDSVGDTLSDIGNAIVVAAGDLCNWLKDATEYVIQIIEDTAQNVWHFVATVGEKLYTFVINTVEKAIAALEAIFEALATVIKNVIQFLKFLFSWEDIARTNAVFSNIIRVYINEGVSRMEGLKRILNEEVASWVDGINDWANLEGVDGDVANQPIDTTCADTDYTEVYTTPNMFLQDLLVENVANTYEVDPHAGYDAVKRDMLEEMLQQLVEAIKSEGEVLEGAYKALKNQLFADDRYKSMTVKEILITLTAILADTVLVAATVIIDLVIDLIVVLMDTVVELLTRPIWIPVISDFLEGLFDYTIPFSYLDMVCMVGSFPGTLVYKVMTQEAPFSEDDGYSTQLIEAPDLATLNQTFGTNDAVDYAEGFYSFIKLPLAAQNILFMTGHTLSGVAASVKGGLIVAEDLLQLPYVPKLSKLKDACGIVQSACSGIASTFAKPYPIQNETVALFSSGVFYGSMASKGIFWALPTLIKSEVGKSGLAEVGAAVDMVFNLTAIAPLAYHFMELSQTPSNHFRSLAIIDETARLADYLGSMAADVAKFNPEPTSSTAIALVGCVLTVLNGGLQWSETIVAGTD